MHKETIWWKH